MPSTGCTRWMSVLMGSPLFTAAPCRPAKECPAKMGPNRPSQGRPESGEGVDTFLIRLPRFRARCQRRRAGNGHLGHGRPPAAAAMRASSFSCSSGAALPGCPRRLVQPSAARHSGRSSRHACRVQAVQPTDSSLTGTSWALLIIMDRFSDAEMKYPVRIRRSAAECMPAPGFRMLTQMGLRQFMRTVRAFPHSPRTPAAFWQFLRGNCKTAAGKPLLH